MTFTKTTQQRIIQKAMYACKLAFFTKRHLIKKIKRASKRAMSWASSAQPKESPGTCINMHICKHTHTHTQRQLGSYMVRT